MPYMQARMQRGLPGSWHNGWLLNTTDSDRQRSSSWAWCVGLPQIIRELVDTCRSHDFTDIVVVHEHRGEPDGLVVCHLPYGPTAYFGVYNTVRAPPAIARVATSVLSNLVHAKTRFVGWLVVD